MKNILLSLIIILVTNVVFAGNFTRDNTAETITDSINSLMWQDNAVVASATYTWIDAIDYCENLDFAGHTDWRLPTINELYSIADYDIYPVIDGTFQNVAALLYWSSTTSAYSTSSAWRLDLSEGGTDCNSKMTSAHHVCCVR